MDETIAEMYRRWRPLNNRCDHKAVFALTYLRTTEEFARTVKADPAFFSDMPWVNWEDAVFAQLYFRPFDAHAAKQPVPAAWRVAFEASESDDVTGVGDLLLGMNAHIQRDLPFTLAHVGLVKPDGQSRKPDHDKVNMFLDRVANPLQAELARRYDERFAQTDAEPSPADELGALQAVREWREGAWRNAERLVNAATQAERDQVAQSIDAYAEGTARSLLAANTQPGYGPERDAYCRSHNTLEQAGEVSGPAGSVSPMRLTVSPRRARAGRLVRFRFRVRGADRRAVAGATIRFGGRTVRSDRRGRASLARRFRSPGRYRVRASKRGRLAGAASVRITRASARPRFTG